MFVTGFAKVGLDLNTAKAAVKRISSNIVRRPVRTKDLNEIDFKKLPLSLYTFKKKKGLAAPAFFSHTGKIHTGGDTAALLGGEYRKMPPQHKDMLNRLGLLHEQSEKKHMAGLLKKKKSAYFNNHGMSTIGRGGYSGHAHPGVIIEESNAVSTLPKELSGSADALKNVRTHDKTMPHLESRFPWFRYGETRVSRHAKKRMSEAIGRDNKAVFDKILASQGIK